MSRLLKLKRRRARWRLVAGVLGERGPAGRGDMEQVVHGDDRHLAGGEMAVVDDRRMRVVADDVDRDRRRHRGRGPALRGDTAVELAGFWLAAGGRLAHRGHFGSAGAAAPAIANDQSSPPTAAPHRDGTADVDHGCRPRSGRRCCRRVRVADHRACLAVEVVDRDRDADAGALALGDAADPVDVGLEVAGVDPRVAAGDDRRARRAARACRCAAVVGDRAGDRELAARPRPTGRGRCAKIASSAFMLKPPSPPL